MAKQIDQYSNNEIQHYCENGGNYMKNHEIIEELLNAPEGEHYEFMLKAQPKTQNGF